MSTARWGLPAVQDRRLNARADAGRASSSAALLDDAEAFLPWRPARSMSTPPQREDGRGSPSRAMAQQMRRWRRSESRNVALILTVAPSVFIEPMKLRPPDDAGLQIRERPAASEADDRLRPLRWPPPQLPGRVLAASPFHRVSRFLRRAPSGSAGAGSSSAVFDLQPRMPVRLRCSNGRRRDAGRRAGRSRNLKLRPTRRSEQSFARGAEHHPRKKKASPFQGAAGARSKRDIISTAPTISGSAAASASSADARRRSRCAAEPVPDFLAFSAEQPPARPTRLAVAQPSVRVQLRELELALAARCRGRRAEPPEAEGPPCGRAFLRACGGAQFTLSSGSLSIARAIGIEPRPSRL